MSVQFGVPQLLSARTGGAELAADFAESYAATGRTPCSYLIWETKGLFRT